MYPKLLHIYGPIEINSFNAALLIGMATALYCALRHPGRDKIIQSNDLINISIETAIAGIVGGRLLHVLSQWSTYDSWAEMLSIWNGGLSILGTVILGVGYALWAIRQKNIPLAPLLDIATIYTPLIHAIGRIGCFLVGCCYGCQTTVPWGITYSHPLVVAPLHIAIHPTQLYSSFAYLCLFLFMRFYVSPRLSTATFPSKWLPQGSALLIYLMGLSTERFFLDFFRGDKVTMEGAALSLLSFQQWIALALFSGAATAFYVMRSNAVVKRYFQT